jgi:ribosome-associated translation inhibitor RaiA
MSRQVSKSQAYIHNIFCAEYDLLGIYEAFGADFIIELTMKFAKASNQTPDALKAIASAAVKAKKDSDKLKNKLSKLPTQERNNFKASLIPAQLPLNTIENVNAQIAKSNRKAKYTQ